MCSLDVDHVVNQNSSANCTGLMKLNKAETAVAGGCFRALLLSFLSRKYFYFLLYYSSTLSYLVGDAVAQCVSASDLEPEGQELEPSPVDTRCVLRQSA